MSRIKCEMICKHSPHLLGRYKTSPPFSSRFFFPGLSREVLIEAGDQTGGDEKSSQMETSQDELTMVLIQLVTTLCEGREKVVGA